MLTFAVSGSTVTASNLYRYDPSQTVSLCILSVGCLFRSADYGLTFSKINSRLESSGTIRLFPQINISPQDYRKVTVGCIDNNLIYVLITHTDNNT